jgi:hypothetical protein
VSKPKRLVKPASKRPAASARREQALLLELQERHGYGLSSLKPSERTGMCFSFKDKTLTPVRLVKLAVPVTSALGKALVANDKADRKRTTRKDQRR